MRNRFFALAVVLGCVLIAAPLFAQNPTGTITGRVSYEGDALPGVTVTVTSPALQGQRTAITSANGDYTFKFIFTDVGDNPVTGPAAGDLTLTIQ